MNTATLVKRETTAGAVLLNDKEDSLNAQFAKWMYKETMGSNKEPNGRILSRERCAMKIGQLRSNKGPVTYGAVTSFISGAREYCENNFNCTIWTIPSVGWRCSNDIETARYCGKTLRKTLAWAERARRVYLITDKKLIHHMIREVAISAGNKISDLSTTRKKFLSLWGSYAEKEKEQLQIEAPK